MGSYSLFNAGEFLGSFPTFSSTGTVYCPFTVDFYGFHFFFNLDNEYAVILKSVLSEYMSEYVYCMFE